ncbi:MAG TPA: sigma-70 family RNA polymerase sigma factor [Gemmataceae bacterium]|jgi:RNA polymerase sigma-70 factor (ECF subfamily)|nr:sigma-70 family RNA polymerase sigma factor [Gemmataceae bacterium]
MKNDPISALLEKLSSGDPKVVEQAFLAYEPYLRMMVRLKLPGRLRAKFDSVDVVQSVWADLLEGFSHGSWRFADVAQLRAFLIKSTRHRFIDRLRQHDRVLRHEQSIDPKALEELVVARQERPSEVAQADEKWQQLMAICPTGLHPILRLRRQGKSLDEISEATGYHKSSIRRILYELADRLAAKQAVVNQTSNE